MNVGEVYNLFRSLVDEPDETFLSIADTQTYLHAGHLEYRATVTDIDPEVFSTRTWIAPTSSEFELAGTIFTSATAVAPPADAGERIIISCRASRLSVSKMQMVTTAYPALG